MNEAEKPSLGERKVSIAEEQLKIEREKLAVQKNSSVWSTIGSSIPIIVALLTVWYGVYSLRRSSQAQFETKVIEIIMQAPSPYEAKGRAEMIRQIFPDLLPQNFLTQMENFDPLKKSNAPYATSKRELLRMLVEHP